MTSLLKTLFWILLNTGLLWLVVVSGTYTWAIPGVHPISRAVFVLTTLAFVTIHEVRRR